MDLIKPWMNVTDICVLVIIVMGMLGGARRGLAGELIKIAIVVSAIFFGWRLADPATGWLSNFLDWPKEDLQILAFFGLIILAFLLLTLIRLGFRLFIDFSFRGKIELIGGALLGLLRATTLCVVILLIASLLKNDQLAEILSKSQSAGLVTKHVRPYYDEWAEKNPAFTLPETGKESEASFPDWDQYLGPLIAPDDEEQQ